MMAIKKTSISNSNRSLMLALVSFFVLVVVAFVGMRKPQLVGQSQLATMTFNFSSGKQQVFNGPVMENMTVLEAVLASAKADDIKATYSTNDKNNVTLTAINDDLNLGDHQWSFYINRKPVKTEDINKIYVRGGDIIEAKYQ